MSQSLHTRGCGLLEDQHGLSTVEYIIILVLIAVIGIAAWKNFGEAVEFKARSATTEVNSLGAS